MLYHDKKEKKAGKRKREKRPWRIEQETSAMLQPGINEPEVLMDESLENVSSSNEEETGLSINEEKEFIATGSFDNTAASGTDKVSGKKDAVEQEEVPKQSFVSLKSASQNNLRSAWFKGIPELEAAYDGLVLFGEGAAGFYVKRIQQALMFLMIDVGPDKDDSIFGKVTKKAVVEFQETWGKNVTVNSINGVVGQETMSRLDEIFLTIKVPDEFKDPSEKEKDAQPKTTAEEMVQAYDQSIGKRISNFGRIGARLANYDEIKTGAGKRIYTEPDGKEKFRLKYNTLVTILGEHKDERSKGWIYIHSPEKNLAGWVQREYVHYAPTPGAQLHFVQSGEMLKDVVRTHYKNIPEEYNDARLLVNAVALVNTGQKGLTYNLPKGEEKTNWASKVILSEEGKRSQAIWNSVIIKEGHNIWLPSITEIKDLKAAGIITEGSLTKEIAEGALYTVQFLGGVVVGVFKGIWEAFIDLFVGAWELLKFIGTVIWKHITGQWLIYCMQMAQAFKEWWDKLDVKHELKHALNDFMYRKTPYEQGESLGKLIGYLIFEVILALATGLIGTAIKWIGRALGKLGGLFVKLAKHIKNLPGYKKQPKPDVTPEEKKVLNEQLEKKENHAKKQDEIDGKGKKQNDKPSEPLDEALKQKIDSIKKDRINNKDKRLKELGNDPDRNVYSEAEAKSAFEVEEEWGYFERYKADPSSGKKGDWIGLSGKGKGKLFDDFGSSIPDSKVAVEEITRKASSKTKFFKSLDEHFLKSDYVILNFTNLKKHNLQLFNEAMDYINKTYGNAKLINVTK